MVDGLTSLAQSRLAKPGRAQPVILNDSANPPAPPITLRRALSNAVGQANGTVITFDPALGNNLPITLMEPLIVTANVAIDGGCTNKVKINATFANALQLNGNTFIRGLQIFTTAGSGIVFKNGVIA